MKQCTTCQKMFDDDKRFCQIDGTPLVEKVDSITPDDPFKTVVGSPTNTASNVSDDNMKTFVISQDEKNDLFQSQESFDPMKTMVVSGSSTTPPPPKDDPVVAAPEPPKFSEPSLNPPSFGDLSGAESLKFEEAKKEFKPIDSPFSTPPMAEPPKAEQPIANPFSNPTVEPPKFDSTPLPSSSSPKNIPFNPPVPPPVASPFDPVPFNQPEPMKMEEPKSFGSPFETPSSPFGQSNDPFANQQAESAWTPPPAPVQSWQDQSVGANTPFQPPTVGMEGSNKTLATVSLVCGILSCLCCFSVITGPVGVITGYLAKGNIAKDPTQYGGANFATIGMITGAIGTIIGIGVIILQIAGAFAGSF